MSDREVWKKFLFPFELLSIEAEAAWHYGDQYRLLSGQGQLIGGNDLWNNANILAFLGHLMIPPVEMLKYTSMAFADWLGSSWLRASV